MSADGVDGAADADFVARYFLHVAAEAEEAARHIQSLEKNLAEAREARAKIESSFWFRAGRKLGAV